MPKAIRRASRLSRLEAAPPIDNVPTDPTAKPVVGNGPGWQPTTLAEMLSLTEVDMRIIDLRLGLIRAIRQIRQEAGLTQKQLAKHLGVSQPRIAELESVEKEPTLDSLLPAYFAVGGTSSQLCEIIRRTDESMNR